MEDLYVMGSKSQGLTTQHKLKHEHIYLTSFSRMRVDLVAQVNYFFDAFYIHPYTISGFEQYSSYRS